MLMGPDYRGIDHGILIIRLCGQLREQPRTVPAYEKVLALGG